MNLEKRVEQLEQRMGTDNDFMLVVISFMGCDPGKLGPERQIQYEVTGYGTVGRDRLWDRGLTESAEELKARVERNVRAEGHKVYAVCERYAR